MVLTDRMGKICSHQLYGKTIPSIWEPIYLVWAAHFSFFRLKLVWSLSVNMVTCHPYVIISLICPNWLTRIFPTECPHTLTISGPIICPHTKKTFFPFICSHTIHMMDSWKYSPYGWTATIQLASRLPTIRHYMVGPLSYSWPVASQLLDTIWLDRYHTVGQLLPNY